PGAGAGQRRPAGRERGHRGRRRRLQGGRRADRAGRHLRAAAGGPGHGHRPGAADRDHDRRRRGPHRGGPPTPTGPRGHPPPPPPTPASVSGGNGGGAPFTLTVGGVDTSVAQTFTLNVLFVNDQPTFTASNPPHVSEDSGAQTVNSWAGNFYAGGDPGP